MSSSRSLWMAVIHRWYSLIELHSWSGPQFSMTTYVLMSGDMREWSCSTYKKIREYYNINYILPLLSIIIQIMLYIETFLIKESRVRSQAEEVASAKSAASFSESERDDGQLNNWLIKAAVYFTISTWPPHFQERPEGRDKNSTVSSGPRVRDNEARAWARRTNRVSRTVN